MSVSGAVNQNQEYGLVLIHFPMRGATRHAEQQQRLQRISIRAPREGSDDSEADQILCEDDFNPRSPRGERHHIRAVQQPRPAVFQSTLPARGATPDQPGGGYRAPFQSTLPARGATGREHSQPDIADISIHAPREGSDQLSVGRPRRRQRFQSTLPARGATTQSAAHRAGRSDFNPRSPRGERRRRRTSSSSTLIVQSTLPARGATRELS